MVFFTCSRRPFFPTAAASAKAPPGQQGNVVRVGVIFKRPTLFRNCSVKSIMVTYDIAFPGTSLSTVEVEVSSYADEVPGLGYTIMYLRFSKHYNKKNQLPHASPI